MDFNALVSRLLEERAATVAELRSMYESAETRAEGERGLTGEEVQTEERMQAAIKDLDGRIKRGNEMAASQRAADQAGIETGAPTPKGDGNPQEEQIDERSAFEAVLRATDGAPRAFETRDNVNLVKGTATDGQELVPTTLSSMLWEHMVDSSPILQTGVSVMNTSNGGDVVIPRTTSYSAAALVAEAAQIGKDAPQFDSVTLNAYKLGFIVQVSSELVQDSAFNIVDFVTRQGGAALGRGADTYFVTGTGTAQPQGIDNATASGTTFSVGTPTMDSLLDIIRSVSIPAARQGAVWMLNDTIIGLIAKLKDTTNQYLWQPSRQAGEPDMLLGYPVYADPNFGDAAAATVGVFGNPAGFYVRQAGGFRIERSDDFAFDTDLSTYRFLTRVDSRIVDDTAFVSITGAA